MNKKQFSKYWWAKLSLALFLAVLPLAACFPKEELAPSPAPKTTPAPQPTPMPYGVGKIIITPREDVDPNVEGNQVGVSINFSLSVQDPEAIKYQYFDIAGNKGSVYVLSGYETPVGEVVVSDFSVPQVSFTKGGINYVCPPVDETNPFIVDCSAVLNILLSN